VTLALEVFGWFIFLVGIGVSIGLHEIGHLLPAKLFGVKVLQYMIGFGPTIWSRNKGETEYGIKAIPLGGYIRMIGMYPPEKGSDGTSLRASTTGRFATLVNDARQQSMDEIAPEDADRVFYKLPVLKRIVIMMGGPVMNLFLAFIFFSIVIAGIGTPHITNTIGQVVPCAPTVSQPSGAADTSGGCGSSSQTPAAAAGLKAGDTIVSFNGKPISSWTDAQTAIHDAPAGNVAVVVDRNGSRVPLTVPMATIEVPVYDAAGKPTGKTEARNFLGVSPGIARQTESITTVPAFMWDTSKRAVSTIVTLPARLWDLTRQTFTSETRDPNGIVGPVGVGRITGEMVALQNTPVLDKVAGVLGLLAGLNLFLFLFNLIPLLPLDGGHVAGAIWESIKRGWARVRHLPDPGPVDIAKALPLTYAMSILLMAMGAIVLYADLVKPITLGG
jgi:membrane-associated protease RseP (regulator of RpoE activity)